MSSKGRGRDTLGFSESAATNVGQGAGDAALAFSQSVGLALVRANVIEHWPRWIVASVAKHFDDRRQGLRMFLEGEDHVEDTPDYVELRVDGPYVLELSNRYFKVEVEVNVFISSAKNCEDLYKLQRDEGVVAKAFHDPVHVFKLGTGVDDDQSLLGCLTLVSSGDAREALRVSHFGQVNADTPIVRSSVEGHFHMELHG